MKWIEVLEGPIKIYVRIGDHLSLTNSPYPPHIVGRAVDIYSSVGYMPAGSGVVKKIVEFRTPINRPDASGSDYAIIVDVGKGYAIKILHVKPAIKVGEELSLGDYIGDLIVSGYMMPWSDKHMHVEVRRAGDELRALGSVRERPSEELIKEVTRRCRYTLNLTVEKDRGTHLEAYSEGQICITSGERTGVLDAGMPHYGVGGSLCLGACLPHGEAYLGSSSVGDVIGEVAGVSILLLKAAVRCGDGCFGLGTYLLTNKVKLIPLRKDYAIPPGSVCGGLTKYKPVLPRWFSRIERWFPRSTS